MESSPLTEARCRRCGALLAKRATQSIIGPVLIKCRRCGRVEDINRTPEGQRAAERPR
jgi:phage FluMu protein Com